VSHNVVEWQGTISTATGLFLLLLVFTVCTLFQRICVGSVTLMSAAEPFPQKKG
jgi:hypothetical protein